MIVEMMPIKE